MKKIKAPETWTDALDLEVVYEKDGIMAAVRHIPQNEYMDHGWGNGYVIVHQNHPWFGYGYIQADVHRGITYGEYYPDNMWMVGFDTMHWGDNIADWNETAVISETVRLLEQAIVADHESIDEYIKDIKYARAEKNALDGGGTEQ